MKKMDRPSIGRPQMKRSKKGFISNKVNNVEKAEGKPL